MNRRTLALFLLFVGLAAVAVVGLQSPSVGNLVASALRPMGASAGSPATEEEAIALIRTFMSSPDLAVSPVPVGKEGSKLPGHELERTFKSSDGKASFTVDLGLRKVVIAQFDYAKPSSAPPIPKDRALQIALDFLKPRVDKVEQLVLVRNDLLGHGPGWQEYTLEWSEQLGSQKAKGLRRIAMTLDAPTGTVTSLVQIASVPVTVSVEPKISRDQAIAVAQQRFGAPTTGSETELSVWWKNNDRSQGQVLKWTVTLLSEEPLSPSYPSGPKKHARYAIDAHSGEILEELR